MNVNVKVSIPKQYKHKEILSTLKRELPEEFKVKSVKLPNKPGSGRKRGGIWELDFCKKLSKWWSLDSDASVFKRAGSLHTTEKGHVFGDVYAVKPDGFALTSLIAIELKTVKESRVETAKLMCGKSSMFADFWDQTVRQAALGDLHPVLVVKMDRYCPLVFNLFDTIGKVRLKGPKSNLVSMCTLNDWFDKEPTEFVEGSIFNN